MSYEEDNYEVYSYYTDQEYIDYEAPDLSLKKENSYMILKEDQLLKERNSIINQAMEHLFLDRNDAILALINYNWSMERLKDEWYDAVDENKIKCGIELSENTIQLLKRKKVAPNNKECLVCMSPKDESFDSLNCKHFLCGECWNDYLSVKLEDILVCLSSKCPQEGCDLIVPEEFFFKFLKSNLDKEKFNKALLRNFTGDNSDLKICPGLSCNICIKCDSKSSKEITCPCGTVFCFRCNRESHRPCTCEIVEKWEFRSKSDSENDKWMMANTKTCPHCKQKIEKSQGCNYMLCAKTAGGCGKAFCYVCEVDWEKHSQDHFNCNMYTPQVKEKETKANKIKAELERYDFYFKRYINYNNAVIFAQKFFPILQSKIDSFINIKLLPLSELEFLNEALKTVISAKRTLKYSYIFGYYIMSNKKEKNLFEYSQSFLERNADNLHQLLEQDHILRIISEDNYENFNRMFIEFKNKIVNLCFATTKYQKNLLDDIENTMMHLIDTKILYDK